MKRDHRKSIHSLLALSALTLAIAAFGCVSAPDLSSNEVPDEPTPKVNAQCCDQGTLLCPTDLLDFDYYVPGCGSPTKPIAQANCKKHCGSVACTDTGWLCE